MSGNNEPFVRVYDSLLYSGRFLSLSLSAQMVLIHVIREAGLQGSKKDCAAVNRFSFPLSRAKRIGMDKSTLKKALVQLEQEGFIETVRQGHGHSPALYKLSCKWKE